LYVVGTPIGNLGDVTLRAIETLRAATRIAAEDTRRTRALLTHLGIVGKPLSTLEAHATERQIERLLEHLLAGESVAFVTDAGMPAVSDPGSALVRAASAHEIPVVVIPGPSAVTAAVATSGLVDGGFSFLGFLPRRGRARSESLERIARSREPVVLFESPSRIAATLAELAERAPDRPAALCRELTKLYEEVIRGTLAELAALDREWRGEITLVVGHGPGSEQPAVDEAALDQKISERLAEGASSKQISSDLAAWSGRSRRDVYARVEHLKRGSAQ
jgi:16S rRNA (cytidine1402-2'-O)-methyltransferase